MLGSTAATFSAHTGDTWDEEAGVEVVAELAVAVKGGMS